MIFPASSSVTLSYCVLICCFFGTGKIYQWFNGLLWVCCSCTVSINIWKLWSHVHAISFFSHFSFHYVCDPWDCCPISVCSDIAAIYIWIIPEVIQVVEMKKCLCALHHVKFSITILWASDLQVPKLSSSFYHFRDAKSLPCFISMHFCSHYAFVFISFWTSTHWIFIGNQSCCTLLHFMVYCWWFLYIFLLCFDPLIVFGNPVRSVLSDYSAKHTGSAVG